MSAPRPAPARGRVVAGRGGIAAVLAALALLLAALALGPAASAQAAEDPDWTGEWQSYWRAGQALMILRQSGNEVTGTYEPGGGRIEGRLEGHVLRGRWIEGEIGGGILFALSEDGETFTGRFDTGEYWNGRRVRETEIGAQRFTAAYSPRETLRTVMSAGNDAVYAGNAAAMRFYEPLLDYGEGEEVHALRTERRRMLWTLLDISTFRIYDAPPRPEGDEAAFLIRPVGGRESFELRFRLDGDGRWKIVVPPRAELEAALARVLGDLGHASIESHLAARATGPRQTMRRFLMGATAWEEAGAAQALATLDLSFLPAHLREIEGPILADYLKQIIDRAGFVIWQELPNDPDSPMPFVFYEHPVGSVVIERVEGLGEDAPARWLFSADTLRTAPTLYRAIQDMPVAEGVPSPEPFTDFFRLREQIRAVSPWLLHRGLLIENWQWLAIGLVLALAFVLSWLSGALMRLVARRAASGDADKDRAEPLGALLWPLRLTVGGGVALFAFAVVGLGHEGFDIVGRLLGLVSIGGATLLLFRLTALVGGTFVSRAAERAARLERESYVDEIVASLATGLVKLLLVVFGIIAAADVVGLPYEGVITGLGVGGIALAFAARDTVSNMIGGAILLADRPFKRGDLIETDGQWASIEDVGLRSTRLRTLDDALLIIPNAQLSDRAIINWGKRRRRKVLLEIGLTYDTPRERLDRFVERLREVYAAQPRADTADCYVGLKGFGPSSIDIELWGYFTVFGYEAQVRARHALVGDIVDLAREVGVSFAFPTRTVHIEQAGPAPEAELSGR